MATPGPSLRLKRLRRHFGIGAPKIAIKAYVAWYWKALAVLVVLAVTTALFVWAFAAGKRSVGSWSDESVAEVLSLRRRVAELDDELSRSRSQANSGESSLQIERATLTQLSRQVRGLESENASLKEDLAFFEGVMPASTDAKGGVRIEHLRIEPETSSGEYHYRLLVINGGNTQGREFKGDLQFLVKVKRQGREATVKIPSDAEPAAERQQYRFESKYFRRLEGVFSLPSAITVLGVEARLLQDGEVRARQTVIP